MIGTKKEILHKLINLEDEEKVKEALETAFKAGMEKKWEI